MRTFEVVGDNGHLFVELENGLIVRNDESVKAKQYAAFMNGDVADLAAVQAALVRDRWVGEHRLRPNKRGTNVEFVGRMA